MADPPLDPDDAEDTAGMRPDRGSATGMPRWVKAFLIVALVVVLLLVILLFTGGGHGPGRHMSTGDMGGPAVAGEARMIEVTTRDTITFEPSQPGHYRAGMRGKISIT